MTDGEKIREWIGKARVYDERYLMDATMREALDALEIAVAGLEDWSANANDEVLSKILAKLGDE